MNGVHLGMLKYLHSNSEKVETEKSATTCTVIHFDGDIHSCKHTRHIELIIVILR